MNNLIELAKCAMQQAAAVHIANEQNRYAAWKCTPPAKRKPYEAAVDTDLLSVVFTDLFEAAVEKVRALAPKDGK